MLNKLEKRADCSADQQGLEKVLTYLHDSIDCNVVVRWKALDAAGIKCVVAEFYARIFFRNSVNGGYIIPFETPDRLCEQICTGDELQIGNFKYQVCGDVPDRG